MSNKTKKLKRSSAFNATRKHHMSETAEDYVELIAELIQSTGEARICNIARHLGISHVTAIRSVRRLKNEGYVEVDSHKPVSLTEKGKKLAKFSQERHRILVEFLKIIGVPSEVAEIDAEGAEHHISTTTLQCMRNFVNNNCKNSISNAIDA
jgi:DtxR family transcriptional regulator, manganese transport regulator